MPNIQDTSHYISSASNAMDALSSFADSDIGNNLGSVSDFLTSSKFSTVASSLGLLGAGLGVIALFQKSDTDRILNAISGLDSKIDDLKTTMLAKFDHLEAVVELANAKSDIFGYITQLDVLKSYVDQYQAATSDEEREIWAAKILQFESSQVAVAVQGIANAAAGAPVSNDLFGSLLAESFGDMEAVLYLGSTLVSYCSFGLMADALIDYLNAAREFTDDTSEAEKLAAAETAADNAAQVHTENISAVYDAWYSAYENCLSNVDSYVGQMMTASILPTLPSDDFEASSKTLHDALTNQWFWLDWFTAVYEDVSGYGKHGWNYYSSSHVMTWKRQQVDGGKVNILVKYTDQDVEATGSGWSTKVDYQLPYLNLPVEETKYTGNGEDYAWDDTRDFFASMTQPNTSPGLVWALKKGYNYWVRWSTSKRALLKKGEQFKVVVIH